MGVKSKLEIACEKLESLTGTKILVYLKNGLSQNPALFGFGGGISGVDINALIENALYQTKVDPEVVIAAARLFVLANQARNYHGYCFVESNQNVVEATNRSSAMSLSNLLLPDEASQSSKTT
nr:4737_t:CDS:2 [Entrophospora candida]